MRNPTEPAASIPAEAAGLLLRWYDRNKRQMPWRDDPTPYHVWLSEIMLQQTRVEAVRGHYARFLEALSDIPALAEAEEARLLKLWEGLGYYSRARNLQKAARIVVEEHGGALPASFEALRKLPGIGDYTAGAVASIAFGIPVPAVDGNVLRVAARLMARRDDVTDPRVKRAFGSVVAGLIPADRPGDFNQALMELGATVCIPNGRPLCLLCPLAGLCAAHRAGCAEELPVKAAKKAPRKEARTIVLLVAEGRALLFRRTGARLLAGMYEPLNLEGALEKGAVEAALSAMGAAVDSLAPMGPAVHRFTHIEWAMTGWLARCRAFDPPEGAQWVDGAALGSGFPLPSAFRAYTKDLRALLEEEGQ